jgi:hypothetical protein
MYSPMFNLLMVDNLAWDLYGQFTRRMLVA